ncbi:MAG: recombinase family protein [Ruminococcaceae bacterium]|nr:recombinase family protein [Oscillospiraceae bacterium]
MDLYKVKNELLSGKSIFDIKLNVVFYARVSTDTKEQSLSLDNQIKYFEDFIKSNKNWVYKGRYVDEAVSGTSVKKRQNFLKMIDDAKENKFDLILTKEISRFSRNTLDSIKYTQNLLKCSVGVYFMSDNINTLMPDSELRLTIMSAIAQDEVRRISERVKFGLKQSVKDGKMLGSAPFGYEKKNGILTIKYEEAIIVKRVFDYYIKGLGLRAISNKLSKENIVNKNKKPFTYSSLRNIISNPKYKGFSCTNKYYSTDFKYGKKLKTPSDEWIIKKDKNIPLIIPENTWNRANDILNERGKNFKDNKSSYQNRYFFSGKVVCKEHKTSYHRVMFGKNEALKCKEARNGCENVSIYKSELEFILNDVYKTIKQNKLKIADYLDRKNESSKNKETLIFKKEKLFELVLDSLISKSEFKERKEKIEKELTNIKENVFIKSDFLNDDFNNFKSTSYVKLKKCEIEKTANTSAKICIYLSLGSTSTQCVSLHETGISQAQVSRLEKSAIDRMKKYI